MVQKPLGVQILSVSIIIVSALFLVRGYRLFRNFSPSFNVFVPFQGVPQLYWLSLVFVSLSVFGFIVGLGLWGVRRWAYYLTLGGSVVLVGLGVILIVGGFDVLYFLDIFSIGLLSVYSLLIFGIGSFLAPLMLGIGLVSIVVGVASLRYLTGEATYSFS